MLKVENGKHSILQANRPMAFKKPIAQRARRRTVMIRQLKAICVLVAMVSTIAMLGGCNSSNKGASDKIVIGAVYPLTGALASTGQNIKKGIDLAVEDINASGGVLGKKLEIVYGDTQGDPKIGMSEMERLITQGKVPALLGAYQSGVTEVVSQVAENNATPLLSAISTADVLTTRGYKYFFRMAPTNMMYLRDMIQYVVDWNAKSHSNLKTVAIVADNTLLGQETDKWGKFWAEKQGLTVVKEVLYARDAADLTSEVLALKSAKPDVLVVDPYVSDAILLVKTMHEQGFKPKIMISKATGVIDPNFVKNLQSQAEGITTAVEWNKGMSKGKDINQKFETKYGISMNGHSAEAYTAVWVLKTAIEQAGEPNRDKIRNALANLKIEKKFPNGPEIMLPYDKISFEPVELAGQKHINQNVNATLGIAQIRDGQYKTVWPFAVAEVQPLVPLPW
jgi:branched-chain amino acid transport system substrate-binding protein